MNADGLARLVARLRLVRDRVLPHAWSVFHCVATPRIPVHHAQKLPIGGELCSYFVLKSLTQSFPLERRDVLRYQRLRKLHAGSPCGELCCAPRLSCGQAISGTRRWASANSKSHSSSTSAATSWLPVALILSNWSLFRSIASTLSKVAEATPRPGARSTSRLPLQKPSSSSRAGRTVSL